MSGDPLPAPEVTPLTKPFWEAAKQHKLVLQKCRRCGRWVWYPRAWCPYCGSRDLEWAEPKGVGSVYAYTIARVVVGNSPEWQKDMPYAVAIVDLDEGVRMYGRIVGVELDKVKVGMRVKAGFEDKGGEYPVLVFKPVGDEDES